MDCILQLESTGSEPNRAFPVLPFRRGRPIEVHAGSAKKSKNLLQQFADCGNERSLAFCMEMALAGKDSGAGFEWHADRTWFDTGEFHVPL